MRRVLHDGQTAPPFYRKASRKPWPQASQRARAKLLARMPHSRKIRREPIFAQAPREGGESQGWDEQSASVRAPHAGGARLPSLVPTPREKGLQMVLRPPVERCIGGATAAVAVAGPDRAATDRLGVAACGSRTGEGPWPASTESSPTVICKSPGGRPAESCYPLAPSGGDCGEPDPAGCSEAPLRRATRNQNSVLQQRSLPIFEMRLDEVWLTRRLSAD